LVGADGKQVSYGKFGSAHIFRDSGGGNWVEEAMLAPGDRYLFESDEFGWSVSISGDIALVGAPTDTVNGFDYAGSAYIFRNDGAGNWDQEDMLTADDGAADDYFGWSVSISGDTVLVGAYGNHGNDEYSGSVYIFREDGAGNWIQEDKLTASDGESGDSFGWSVSMSGDTALVGASSDDDDMDRNSGSAYIIDGLSEPQECSENYDICM